MPSKSTALPPTAGGNNSLTSSAFVGGMRCAPAGEQRTGHTCTNAPRRGSGGWIRWSGREFCLRDDESLATLLLAVTGAMSDPVRVLELRSVRGTGGGPEKTILHGAALADSGRVAVTVCYLRDPADPCFEIGARAAVLGLDYV